MAALVCRVVGERIGKVSLEAVGHSAQNSNESELKQGRGDRRGEDIFKGSLAHRTDGIGFGQVGAGYRKSRARNA